MEKSWSPPIHICKCKHFYRISEGNQVQCYLKSANIKENAMYLEIGDKAPDFILESHLEKKHRLCEYTGKIVVLAFFPLAWTPV